MKMLSYLKFGVIDFFEPYKAYKFHLSLIFICSLYALYGSDYLNNEVKHHIKVIHKGISLTERVECTLVEVQNAENQPQEYYMDVKSVVCGDSRCRVDLVRIYWDKLGRFDRLQLPKGVELEKTEGEDFEVEDYQKLNRILKDANSSLKDVYKMEIVSTVGSEGVDAMTGATVLVEKSSYVEGAVWTCYSLWHWTHGEAKSIIRNITGAVYSITELQDLLQQSSDYQRFALEQFIRRQDFSTTTVNAIINAIQQNPRLLKSSLSYFELASNSIYTHSLSHLITISNTKNRLLCLNHILKTKQNLSPDFFNNLDLNFSKLTYQEIHLLLKILENKNAISTKMIDRLLPLLNHADFLIARRMYWFLSEIELSKKQKKVLDKFYKKNENRL